MASAVIGALRVQLGLDSAQFQRGSKDANASLAAMGRQFAAVSAAAAAFGAAILGAARNGAQEIDNAAKAARRIGGTVAGYRALEMAADDAGVSLSSLASDVQTMNRELARAEIGEGRAGEALERLGMAAEDFAGLDADERVALLADRVKELGLDTGETTLLLRDLGVRNREMALLVMQGGDALRAARRDVNEFGLAISDVDAARIEAANDEIAGLADITTYVSDQLALKFVPAMGNLAKAMTDSLREGGALRQVIDALISNLDRAIVYVGTAVAAFGTRFVAALVAARIATFSLGGALVFLRGALIRTGIGALVVGAGELIYQFTRLVDATGSWGDAMAALGGLAVGVWEGIKTSASSIVPAIGTVWESVQAGFFRMIQAIQERWAGFLGMMASAARNIPFMEGGIGALNDAAASAESGLRGIGMAAAEAEIRAASLRQEAGSLALEGFEQVRVAAARLAAIVNTAGAESAQAADAVTVLDDALDSVGGAEGGGSAVVAGSAIGDATDAMSEMGEVGNRVASTLASGFTSMVTGIIDGSKSIAESIGDMLKSIGSMFLNNGFSSIFSNIFGAFTGGFGGGFTAPTSFVPGGFFPAFPSFDGGGFTGLGARAGGMDGRGGFPAILHPNETVVDHTRTGSTSGRIGIDVSVSVDRKGNLVPLIEQVAGGEADVRIKQYDGQLGPRLADKRRRAQSGTLGF